MLCFSQHASDDEDDDSSSAMGVSKPQRYFKNEHVLTKYDFNYYRYPDMKDLAVYKYKEQVYNA